MKPAKGVGTGIGLGRLGLAAFVGFFLLPLALLTVIRSDVRRLAIVNLQVVVQHGVESTFVVGEIMNNTLQPAMPHKSQEIPIVQDAQRLGFPTPIEAQEIMKGPVDMTKEAAAAAAAASDGSDPLLLEDFTKVMSINSGEDSRSKEAEGTSSLIERFSINNSTDQFNRSITQELAEAPFDQDRKASPNSSIPAANTVTGGSTHKAGKIECDFSELRTDICEVSGDVRIHGNSSSITLVEPSITENVNWNTSQKIRPYARKWESPTMSFIKELSLRSAPASNNTLQCNVNHSIPAVVFSTGGFQGNFFHELTDVLIPLFLTSYQYQGEVQFLIVDFKSWWFKKYQPILTQLSRYKVVNLDMDNRVHCFREAVVGLRSHKELGIDSLKVPKGYTMIDFRQFLRKCYSLKRGSVKRIRRKPKLLLMSRKKSRAILNEREVINMARGLGFKVVVAEAELTKNLSRFARVVNSCDIMMGVHGAGLSNMVFLPTNATLIQVIPWGEMKWACRFAFGEPAEGMGLRYMEYEIGKEESSLIKQYPRDHAVFTNPLSIHKQGFSAVWSIFLEKQNLRLDVGRFRSVLLEARQSYRH